jgi:hypothetical protein
MKILFAFLFLALPCLQAGDVDLPPLQVSSPVGLDGKFIQFRFEEDSFLDDSHEIGGGNLLVRWNPNSTEPSLKARFMLADTFFLVDDLTFELEPCISKPENCQVEKGTEQLFKSLNKYTYGHKTMDRMEFCLVELRVETIRMQNISVEVPNFDCVRKKDPCLLILKKPTWLLKCEGRPDQ